MFLLFVSQDEREKSFLKLANLERNLSKTPGTFDVEPEYRQPQVQLILNSFLASIELLPFVDILTTCFTPANIQSVNINPLKVTF